MTIDLRNIEQVKLVEKPWGYEKWIQPGSDDYPYVLKELCLRAGQRTSLQVHQCKAESIVILKGTGSLLTSDIDFNCTRYINNEYTKKEIEDIISTLREIPLTPGIVFHTPPGTIHRMVANEDLVYIEASTTELDDVIRLQDDKNRQHGRIDSEHK
jgi:mannose-6-phosphate isomerase